MGDGSEGNLIHSTALDMFLDLEKESVDLLLTDPPYRTISGGSGPDPKHKRPKGMLKANDGRIFEHNDLDFMAWLPLVYDVLKPGSHAYIFTNFLNLEELLTSMRSVGFGIHNLLIWKKNNATPNRWYMKDAEYIIFGRKGPVKAINDCGSKTVLQFDNVRGKSHPTEKPVDLLSHLILNSTEPDDIVLDPFMGTGSCAVAARKTGRRFIGYEIDHTYFNTAKERLNDL